jgi:hypothetical protein
MVAAKPTADARVFFLPEVFLEQFAGLLPPSTGHSNRFGFGLGVGDVAFTCSRSIASQSCPFHALARHSSSSNIVSEKRRQHHLVHFFLVVFHRAHGLEFAARVALRDSNNHRTDAG